MNRLIGTCTLILAAAAAAGPAAAATPKRGGDEIPFVSFGGIRNWYADDDSRLYVEGPANRWYEVDLAYPCYDLPFALRIGVDTGASDSLDTFSSIIVDGQRCPVASVSEIAEPPARTHAGKG